MVAMQAAGLEKSAFSRVTRKRSRRRGDGGAGAFAAGPVPVPVPVPVLNAAPVPASAASTANRASKASSSRAEAGNRRRTISRSRKVSRTWGLDVLLETPDHQPLAPEVLRGEVVRVRDGGRVQHVHQAREAPRPAVVRGGRKHDQGVGAPGQPAGEAASQRARAAVGDVVRLVDDDDVPVRLFQVGAVDSASCLRVSIEMIALS